MEKLNTIEISEHYMDRASERRNKKSAKSVKRYAKLARERGTLIETERNGRDIYLFDGFLHIFEGDVAVTIFRYEGEYSNQSKKVSRPNKRNRNYFRSRTDYEDYEVFDEECEEYLD